MFDFWSRLVHAFGPVPVYEPDPNDSLRDESVSYIKLGMDVSYENGNDLAYNAHLFAGKLLLKNGETPTIEQIADFVRNYVMSESFRDRVHKEVNPR